MAEEIELGDWVVSVSATPDGGLSIAVARDAVPYATVVVPGEDAPPAAGRGGAGKLKRDMDF